MTQFQPYDLDTSTTVLTDDELNDFFNDLDHDQDGFVTLAELESKFNQVHNELDPDYDSHSSHGDLDDDCEKGPDPEREGHHVFLKALFPGPEQRIDRQQFIDHVRTWNIPSQNQTSTERQDSECTAFEERLSWRRALRVRWIVQGPKTMFVIFVIGLQIGFGTWQGIEFIYDYKVRECMGWAVVVAKFCAGALYPTLFLMILSMSRIFATFMRRFFWISRVIDWDRNQSFHIWMAVTALVLGTTHGLSHLAGSFVTASSPERQVAAAEALGDPNASDAAEGTRSYVYYLTSAPGLTGIFALSLFWIMALLSMPVVRRRWPYELFQCVHLLMFPIMALLSVHGITRILGQFPMLGFWLVIPGCLVIYERSSRVIRGFFFRNPAHIRILDEDTVSVTCTHPKGKDWRYQVGQYILLQVPTISLFQWHPFTVSACSGSQLQLHIKASGDWTRKLRTLPADCQVGVDGPFGAPSQRFYEFNKSITIGSGVGITPFSAIIADLVQHADKNSDPWAISRRSSGQTRRSSGQSDASKSSSTSSIMKSLRTMNSNDSEKNLCIPQRRVDFHWMVREENHLMWFSSLLNYAKDMFEYRETANLQLNINTYVTARRKNISSHVFRYLLDAHRTPSNPLSALTGLQMRSLFHRPNLQAILQQFHIDMKKEGLRRERIGVFFCGNPRIGRVLADLCAQLTFQARRDGSHLVYVFVMEVFG